MRELEGNIKNPPGYYNSPYVYAIWDTKSYWLNSCQQAVGLASGGLCKGWSLWCSGFDSSLCAGPPWFFRLPATYAGRHPQWHCWATGKGVRAADSLVSRGVPFTSGIFQPSGNRGLWLWRRLPEKSRDDRLGGPQRLLSLAHPNVFMPKEEKRFYTCSQII